MKTWMERINAISVNPDMATREDVARMASDLTLTVSELMRLMDVVGEIDHGIIHIELRKFFRVEK